MRVAMYVRARPTYIQFLKILSITEPFKTTRISLAVSDLNALIAMLTEIEGNADSEKAWLVIMGHLHWLGKYNSCTICHIVYRLCKVKWMWLRRKLTFRFNFTKIFHTTLKPLVNYTRFLEYIKAINYATLNTWAWKKNTLYVFKTFIYS